MLDDRSDAKQFFTSVLTHLERAAHRIIYFQMSPTLLLFLKLNFCAELGDFNKKIVEDSGFCIFSGYERGPTSEELEKYKTVQMSPKQLKDSDPKMLSAVNADTLSQMSGYRRQPIQFPIPTDW